MNNKRVYYIIILVMILLSGCTNKNHSVMNKGTTEKISSYNFEGKYEIINNCLYIDSTGISNNFRWDKMKEIWSDIDGSLLPKQIIIKHDSIFFKDHTSSVGDRDQFRVINDSIYLVGQNKSDPEIHYSFFIGLLNSSRSQIQLCKRYYFYLKKSADEIKSRYGNWYGFERSEDVFNKDGFFNSPNELNVGDTIAWCNIKYIYNLTN